MKTWPKAAILAGATAIFTSWPAGTPGLHASPDESPRAPGTLSQTGLYAAGRPGEIDEGNRAFAPQYPLWSDGATKRRWVHLPAGTTLDVTAPDAWEFPLGTKFWKEFSFNGRKVETRFLWKASGESWVTASYLWNDDGTDAVLAPPQGVRGVAEVAEGRRHSVPSVNDCAACHGGAHIRPLGFTALQLSTDRDPNAIHGEPLQPGMVTLETLVAEGRLSPAHPEFVRTPPRIATRRADTRAVLGYLATNCGSCHNGKGEVAALGPVLRGRDLLEDGDAVARALVRRPTTWQVPGAKEGESVLLDPASPETSAMLVRMRSRRPSSQMPPLGTVIRDEQAIEAVTRWLMSDLAHDRE